MSTQFQQAWHEMQQAVSLEESSSVFQVIVYLVLGGCLALYLRFLYAHCGAASDAGSFTRVFPLLTIVTTAVIAVVKSSLALSLGLVGALSIVRFRAAIKDPEELVYLFLCIALGLSLGAEQPLLAVALVAVASLFILGMHVFGRRGHSQRMLLTISGNATQHFSDPETSIVACVQAVAGRCVLHRLDIENGRGQARIMLPRMRASDVDRLIADLRNKLPECEFSFVDMTSIV